LVEIIFAVRKRASPVTMARIPIAQDLMVPMQAA